MQPITSPEFIHILSYKLIKDRVAMEFELNTVKDFIKVFIAESKDRPDRINILCSIIKTYYPQYQDYLEKVLLLL